VQNISARPQIRLKIGRTWHPGTATLLPGDDAWTRRKAMDQLTGWMGRADGIFFRSMASTPMTVRVDLGQQAAAIRPGPAAAPHRRDHR
jgi:hypothetical protein